MAGAPAHLKTVVMAGRAHWRAWLEAHHAAEPGVVLIYHKLGLGTPSVTYPEAVQEALCFGWIDTTRYTLDAARYQQVFVPRRVGSGWSRLNRSYVGELNAAGLMTAAGRTTVEAAQQDGSWTRLEAGESLEVPPELQAAFDVTPPAAANFTAFPASVRKYILQWIADARRPATRQQRIEQTAQQAARNVRVRGERPAREG